jgi:predicted Zn-dependent peptidase
MYSPRVLILPNGLQLLYLHYPDAQVSHCGVMVRTGTRDEPQGKEGLAHFIEHLLFKGTSKRKSFHILNRLEVVGGELNAYTTKEETCLHASVMNEHLPRALDLLSDITFNSVFPEKEVQKEKDVIIDEIHSYQDTPYEQIFDDFETLVFRQHPLGNPILGTESSVRSFSRKDLVEQVGRFYHPSYMVLAISGNAGWEKIQELAHLYFGGRKPKAEGSKRKPFSRHKPNTIEQDRAVNQVHYISGRPAFSLRDSRRYGLVLLNNLLGGPGMNSRLNLNIRERYGFTYTIESGYHSYTDNGIFYVYFATDADHYERTRMLLRKELQILIDKPLSERHLKQYKEQLLGQIRLSQENRLSLLLSMAKGQLNLGRIVDIDEVTERIHAVTSHHIRDIAAEIFSADGHTELVYRPKLQAADSKIHST